VNVLSTVRREFEQRKDFESRESNRLHALLGHGGDVNELSTELANKIRSDQIATDDVPLREHIRESLREALSINNPRWIR
jgi:hypothetical protein